MAWTLFFHHARMHLNRPAIGVVLGLVPPAMGFGFIGSLYHSIHLPEYRDVYSIIHAISLLWSFLTLMCCTGCVLLGLRSYRVLRGRS
jgi:hypothetical protein